MRGEVRNWRFCVPVATPMISWLLLVGHAMGSGPTTPFIIAYLLPRNVCVFIACVAVPRSDASEDSNVSVTGGEFTCESTRNGGFLLAADGASVVITSGLVANNTAARRGAAVRESGVHNVCGEGC